MSVPIYFDPSYEHRAHGTNGRALAKAIILGSCVGVATCLGILALLPSTSTSTEYFSTTTASTATRPNLLRASWGAAVATSAAHQSSQSGPVPVYSHGASEEPLLSMGRLDNPARIEGIEGGISAQETGSHPLRALLWMAVASVGGLLYFRRFLEPSDISSMAMVSSAGEEAEKAEKAEADVKVAEVLPDNEEAEITTIAESQAGWLLRYGIGRVCFWCQLWLSVIAATVAIFSVQYAYSGSAAAFGLGFTMISTAASFLSTLWTLRCRRIGKLLRREVETKDGKRPTKGNVIRLLWSGLLINSQGLLAAIVGIQANAGLLLAQSLQAGQTVMVPGFGRGVAAFDVFAQLAQAQALFSLIIGTCLALHTLRCISKPFARPATK